MTPTAITPSRWRSAVVHVLFRLTSRRDRWPYRLLWPRLLMRTRSWRQPVNAIIHGHRVIMNANYAYPLTCRTFRTFNAPLLELTHQTYLATGRAVRVVDIGAAIGDTVLFLRANAGDEIAEFICIDGDEEFFGYLIQNVGSLPNCRCIHTLLSSAAREERALVRTHAGTASAQGSARTAAEPLDLVLQRGGSGPIDVLKIDVDGFDGEVLAGAGETLRRDQPSIIFEWHPKLYRQTGNDPHAVFATLQSSGYRRLLWFTKFGTFSHYGQTDNAADHRRLERHCCETVTDTDCHFDVVALPERRAISEQALADLQFAQRRRSPA